MSKLLNRRWAHPRGEWAQSLRTELPALAAAIVGELRTGIPGFPTHIEGIDHDVVRQHVEAALLTTLGYREPSVTRKDEGNPRRRHALDSDPLAPLRAVTVQGRETGPDRARQELLTALTSDTPVCETALHELAEAAHWPLPDYVRAIVLTSPGETQQLAAVLGDALLGLVCGQPCLLVPTPDPEARTTLESALHGWDAVVGHPVPPRDTASSQRWAGRLLSLIPIASDPDAGTVFVDDHLSTMMLLQDEHLAHAFAAHRLRPLADLTPGQRARLEETLLAWLEGGGAPGAARALSVHPQTVRYRMRQLTKLFGPDLRNPRTRFELELALRSRRLMAKVERPRSRLPHRGRAVPAKFHPPEDVARMARVNGL
ncbi:helix-turn-helix domain-containing protein [Streptomyces sp. Isolate_45]|uniref:PucR family transcriptional regulator n=1 Tax=Streptomyces sp. Isolate_45 TaxID=2950111 RepID=UPI002481E31C|nr:helix-turn-helix domain-containing protein [Streptomyces sp. Isolate_45]MDA5282020.1 helix-turn-helix domain-containing protein [Streptomyces sp. Isolate_45]